MKKETNKHYISDTEKKQLDKELLPNGIFYYEVNHSAFDSILKRLDSQFETINDYKDTLKKAIQRNGLIFRQSLNGLNRVEVIDAIKVQYSYYKETCNNMSNWLNATKDLIIKGFNIEKKLSKEIQYDFNTWYDNEISINELSKPQQSNIINLKTNKLKDNKSFTQRQIAIAYYILGITLNEKNYLEILKKHSETTSSKILQKLIIKPKQLTILSNNKTTDTKHLRDLNEAKRLLSGIKKTNEVKLINGYINTFESNYKNEY